MAMPFTNLFAQFDRIGGNPKLEALRHAARTRLQQLATPSARNEDWRFTNVSPIVETPWELPKENHQLSLDFRRHHAIPRHQTRWVWFINGQKHRGGFDWPIPGPEMGAMAELKDVPRPLGHIASERENFFTALNTSLLGDGYYVTVPDGMVVETPVVIDYISQTDRNPIINNPRTLLVVGKNAHVTLIERYVGEHTYLTNAVTEIAVGEGAVVDHVKIQDESTTAYHIANTQVVMAARSNFTTHYLSLGGALVRNEVRVRFDGEHAEATVNGLYLAGGKQHIDNFTVIDHAQPNCASHELYKGILADKSHGVFNGKIFVRKDAQKTDAKQTNKVLLLSDDATINTKPQLEIFADDVKCTHGATIGQLDATQLFYLQSRGIPAGAARKLLTFAFANDIVNRVKIEAIREELEARIVR
jgi:Fe-S cluster assembly protein SufD